MATRQDKVQISIAFLTDESKDYARLIETNKKFIQDMLAAKREGKDLSQVIRDIAASGNAIKNIPLDQVAPAQLVSRARQLQQVLQLIPQSAPEYKALELEYKAINDQLAEMRARTKGVSEGMTQMRTEGGALNGVLLSIAGTFGGLSLDNLLSRLGDYLSKLFEIGTALDTMRQKTATVFGESQVIVQGFAETNAAEIGLATQEYIELATAAGDLVKPMGFTEEAVANLSVSLTDQAGILAEWSQGKVSTKEASEILTKSLLGERDGLNRLGIDIKDSLIQDELKKKGLQDLTGESLRQAEALITLEQITKQSASANEAFAKNTDSNQRQMSLLRARIAEVSQTAANLLVPVFRTLISVGLALIDWGVRFVQTLIAIPGFIRDNQVAIGLLVTSLLALNAQGILAAANMLRMAAAQQAATIATNAQALAQRALNFVMAANPIGLVISVVAALAAIFVTAYQKSETFRRIVVGTFQAITGQVINVLGFLKDLGAGLVNLFTGKFSAAIDNFGSAFSRLDPRDIGAKLKSSFNQGWDSVPTAEPEIVVNEPKAQAAGSQVGAAMAAGFEQQFDLLKKTGEKGADAVAKATKERLEARLKEIEIGYLKEELVTDRALFQQEINEGEHAKRILELKRDRFSQEIEAFREFHLLETREALDAQKKLQEIEQQLTRNPVAPLAPLATKQAGPVTSQTAQVVKNADVSAAADEIQVLKDKFARVVDEEQKYELLRAEMLRNSLAARLQFLSDAGLQETDVFKETLDAKLKADEDYQAKRLENEERTAKLRTELEKKGFDAQKGLFDATIELLSRDEQARKKNGAVIKALKIAQVQIDSIREIQGIWASVSDIPPPFGQILGAVLTAATVIRAVTAVSKIQNTKFAGGGYTGIGLGMPDETGHRPVGVVHEREWVGPRWMVESPEFGPVIRSLEMVRQRGFADGGYSTTPAPSVAGIAIPGVDQNLLNAFAGMTEEVKGLRSDVAAWNTRLKASVVYTDIETAGAELDYVRDDASI